MMLKAIGIAVVAVIACSVIKSVQPGFVPFVIFSAGLGIFILSFSQLREIFGYFYGLCDSDKYGDYFKVMLKGVGVSYLACVGADLCRDNGEHQLAGRVELAAKAELLVLAFPLIKSIIELSEGMLLT